MLHLEHELIKHLNVNEHKFIESIRSNKGEVELKYPRANPMVSILNEDKLMVVVGGSNKDTNFIQLAEIIELNP